MQPMDPKTHAPATNGHVPDWRKSERESDFEYTWW